MAGKRNTLRYIAAAAGVVALTLALSCKDSNPVGPDGSPSDVVFPADSVSYSQSVQVLFNQTCALPSCHSSGEGVDRVKLDNYQNLRFGVNGLSVVIPGSPDQSELVLRIEGRTGDRMPINRNPLNQNQINGIRTWIAEGAKDN
jgi:Planctomycete cytochrome C